MTHWIYRLIGFVLIVSMTGAKIVAAERLASYVVLVSVDGLSASYLNDPRAEMPNLRALAKTGAFAEGMHTSFPSVTWPSHTSLVTGTYPARHGVIGNRVWNRKSMTEVTYIGDPALTKEEAIQVPTLYDVAHQAGLSTASVIWPCSNGAKTLNWIIPDSNRPELHSRYTTPGFADELSEARIDITSLGKWGWNKQYSSQRDLIYTQVARYLLQRHQVNLILVHLITPDGVEHAYGPQTPAAYQAVTESDQRIGEIWEVLQQPPFVGHATLFVVSDHGFAPYETLIRPNAVIREQGLLEVTKDNEIVRRQAWCVAQGGSAFIYILDETDQDRILQRLTKRFGDLEGVINVLSPADFVPLGVPNPQSNPEAPDLVLTTGPGYSFDNTVDGPPVVSAGGQKGTHGHDPRPEYMHAMFVATGAGITSGAKMGVIDNVDVAPTIARLFGLVMETDGRILTEILSE